MSTVQGRPDKRSASVQFIFKPDPDHGNVGTPAVSATIDEAILEKKEIYICYKFIISYSKIITYLLEFKDMSL